MRRKGKMAIHIMFIATLAVANLTGLAAPRAEAADPLVSSFSNPEVLRYDRTTGTVIDDFISARSGIDDPIRRSIRQGSISVRLEPVATGLPAPTWGTVAPGDNERLFVTDQDGILWAIDLATGEKTIFLDASDRLVELGIGGPGNFDERGLLGVAFHPDYATNGLLYTYTSEPVNGPADFSTMPPGMTADHQSVINEWQVPDPTHPDSVIDPTSAVELLRIDQPQFNHDGGGLVFGPDEMLYLSLGDGGGADDEGVGHGTTGNGQDPSNVLGAILRFDPNGSNSANGQYGIPADNPFVDQPGFVEEIFAYGFRNPFRFSFDMDTGDMYIADVGQNDIEEIDIGIAGGNYGWNLKEGTFCFEPNGNDAGFVTRCRPREVPSDLIDPIAQYDHDEGIAVIGGFVYRGNAIQDLQGRYIFGDFAQTFNNDGRLFFLGHRDRVIEFQLVGQEELGLSLLGFGQDANGELYVMANATGVPSGDTGVVLRIAPPVSTIVHSDIAIFNLEDLSIEVGTTVEWHNHDPVDHTSTSGVSPNPDGIWDSGLFFLNETFSFTFNEAGSFPYFCTVHPFMTGTVTVTP